MSDKKQLKKSLNQNKKSKPTFYIVTPSYNQKRYIKKTIKSVLSQFGEFNIKYLIMDGLSTDGTVDYLRKQKGLIYFSKKDKGQTNAINNGIIFFKDKYKILDQDIFAYINSDDLYQDDAFSRVANIFSGQRVNWVIGDCQIIDEKSREIQKAIRWFKTLLRILSAVWPSMFFIINPVPQPAVFIRFKIINKIGQFNEELNYTMDYEYWLRLIKNGYLPTYTSKTLANFRIHGKSKGSTAFIKQFAEEIEVGQKFTQGEILNGLHWLSAQFIINIYKLIKK